MKKALLASGIFALGFIVACGGGGGGGGTPTAGGGSSGGSAGGGATTPQFVNVNGQIVASQGVNPQSLNIMQTGCNINGVNLGYVVAVSIDQNGNLTAAGAQLGSNCSFNLSLNTALRYGFVVFDDQRRPLALFADTTGRNAFRFRGDVSITATLVDTNGDGTPDTAQINVDNPQNVELSSDDNLRMPITNPQSYDRDGNGVPDFMDDLNGNGIPDSMEDRNNNGHPDSLEDWDGNGIVEGFEDENNDGIPDHIEDHDMNGHPEYHDCNENGRFGDEEHEGEEGYECPAPPTGGGNQGGQQGGGQQGGNQGGGNQGGGNQGGNQGGGTPPTVSFSQDVMPILQSRCQVCHQSGGVAGNTRFIVADVNSTYNSVINLIDLVNPQNSRLLRKGAGLTDHGGGQVIAPNSPEFQTILQWIQEGAPNN